ncbi:PREDICTED: E3 ubiquitin-protein ligase CCNB1IP1-like [Amphimedon queenslandica]|uniref:Uncharacterized protein n=1 Tax=Amphimedon queenslandica TaxID=400682 RepID=A0A1X7U9D8_AMPQE|nr:PREDICTED: E3 ubiquitin-protein ligase CCNB1IP1-like [Amphimedon queenslandica]|eukprot:XP_019855434.1 PREDICTED: E3 ubiquitin-protein ligase CCNB1IP1-like [Amphimedon queenslandica]
MATDDSLVCNFKKCRKRLTNFCWVTSCSHVFCDEDAEREFSRGRICPACETQLPGNHDITRVDLQPPEEYKSMVLAGLRPEIIMEIAARGLSFWSYQSHQEKLYHEYCSSKAKEKLQQNESYYEQMMSRTQAELTAVKAQAEALRKELDATKLKYNESSEKLMDKGRQYQKLQTLYDSLRRRTLTLNKFDETDYTRLPLSPHHFLRPPQPPPITKPTSDTGPSTTFNIPILPHAGGPGLPTNKGTAVGPVSSTANPLQVDPNFAAAVFNAGAIQHSNATRPEPLMMNMYPPHPPPPNDGGLF